MNNILPINTTWDCYCMSLAFLISVRSKDKNTKVGAVLKTDSNELYSGYNGAPANFNDELLDGDKKQPYIIHAEMNALLFAGLEKCRAQEKLTLYITFKPCPSCALFLVHFNVKKVIYYSEYKSTVNDENLLEKIRNRGGLSGEPAFEIEKYDGAPLLFSHNHMGIK